MALGDDDDDDDDDDDGYLPEAPFRLGGVCSKSQDFQGQKMKRAFGEMR